VVPAKLEPVAFTAIPEAPDVGFNVSVGAEGTTNVAAPASPAVPVTKTV
jgi:hypothetical protein